MSFDLLAPHYRWMEWVLAGDKLQHCRTAFLDDVRQAKNVLLLGEGNGRFLKAFVEVNSAANITVLDASAAMLRQAQRNMAPKNAHHRVEYIHADVFAFLPPSQRFDLIVSNFFFDCFRPDQLEQIIPRLTSFTSEDAQWIVSDFCVPARGWARWRARGIIAAMYCFFRVVTQLPAREITPVAPLLEANGFRLLRSHESEWGLLRTDLWKKAPELQGSRH
jgi:ubiquinone/menaquinone biosynthesis C-methylase UbiE